MKAGKPLIKPGRRLWKTAVVSSVSGHDCKSPNLQDSGDCLFKHQRAYGRDLATALIERRERRALCQLVEAQPLIARGANGRSIAYASQTVDGVGSIPTRFRASLVSAIAGLEFRPLA